MRSASIGRGLEIFKHLGGGHKGLWAHEISSSTGDIFSLEYLSRIEIKHLICSNSYQPQMLEATAFGPSEEQHLLIRKIPIFSS